ncbi:glycoside hydrolase family 3 C-terminal domain-containing protein [Gracilibacillus sp. YIM 98692]|uniref:glycoside hydrolase family 3 C-terminal domain-containing protein n=1 Tax=Gracilibacillus sp. YIM 98692 TaxID=2663532 RepID=UPI0013D2931A|nr:glycoside hydrolase family 3 C-terminal domain-containing protein [Gracilibacillus sp. YIM 98692]
MTRDIRQLIEQMTLEEKVGMCSGLDFWFLKGVERLGIPSIMVTDGPHGLRKQAEDADHLGLSNSVPATCFPSAVGLASSWDRKLIEKVGIALGEEAQAENVGVLLGPGANIKRSPLCGRNFEYFSEDPYLSSEMAANHIKGIQSQGVGTSLKHFAANNQEHRRMSTNAVVDERTLREIYLASFEQAVKKAEPWTVMCSYNKVNGEFAAESKNLLTDILRDEWGFEGFVVSDWGAVNERVDGLEAGLELEMPSSYGLGDNKILAAVKSGKLSEVKLDRAVQRLLRIIFMAVDYQKEDASYDKKEHHQLAKQVASEGMVLLKNDRDVLPLSEDNDIAVIGALAKKPRYQGGGSSHINPTQLDDIYEEMKRTASGESNIAYAQGYDLDSDKVDDQLVEEAKRAATQSDAAVLFIGLPDRYESEGYDRVHLDIPENQRQLIEEVAKVQPNVIVVLSNGAPIEMPWLDKAKAVLEGYLGGQALGGAITDILFGNVNPSGKLAETFPIKLSDNPSYLNFPGEGDTVEYKEGIFVGYRYYDTKEVEPLFPFGYGLSYTTFEYSDLSISQKDLQDTDTVTVKVTVKNTGEVAGKEVVQLYVKDVDSSVIRPEKELKGFEKVALQPGEAKEVSFTLDKRAFAYYNVELQDWHVETGDFEILIGKSSQDIVLKDSIHVTSTVPVQQTIHRNTTVGDLLANPDIASLAKELLQEANKHNPLMDAAADSEESSEMMEAMMKYLPLRALANFSGGHFTEEMLQDMIDQLNEAQKQKVLS